MPHHSSAEFMQLALADIWVPRDLRQRSEINTAGLLESIRQRGVYNPVIVMPEAGPAGQAWRLVAGERRLTCCQELGWSQIPARLFTSLSEIEAQIIELEENIKRQDLTWQDIVRSVARIHALYASLEAEWTMAESAEEIGLSPGAVSMYLKVEKFLGEDRIANASTVREAYNILARRDQRASGEALAELLESGPPATSSQFAQGPQQPLDSLTPAEVAGITQSRVLVPGAPLPSPIVLASGGLAPPRPPLVPDPAKSILLESFLQWAPRYSGPKFNLVHCDFPYGVNLFAGPQGAAMADTGQAYDDSRDLFFRLLECFCTNLDRFMSVSAHLLFWYSDKHREEILATFARLAPSLRFWPFPLVWFKTDNAGIAQNVRQGPRHVYETCLLATRSSRNIVKVVSDCYGAPTDKKWHPSTKPEPMLRHFMSMLVDEHTSLLDPTCGSASSLRAAESLGAKAILGMDADEQTVGLARTALRQARTLRGTGLMEG